MYENQVERYVVAMHMLYIFLFFDTYGYMRTPINNTSKRYVEVKRLLSQQIIILYFVKYFIGEAYQQRYCYMARASAD